jgi:hypothetical protein
MLWIAVVAWLPLVMDDPRLLGLWIVLLGLAYLRSMGKGLW